MLFVIEWKFEKNTGLGPIEEGPVCVLNSNNAQGQETPVGNRRGEQRSASSPERRGQWQPRYASIGWEAIALGMS